MCNFNEPMLSDLTNPKIMNRQTLISGAIVLLGPALMQAQDQITHHVYDPHLNKLIPDKVFEFAVPILFIYLLFNSIVAIIKTRADNQVKMKMLEKGVSEETILLMFQENKAIKKLQPLKYFLICASLGLALIVIHFCKDYLVNESGYMAIGIILVFTSVAFLIYYRLLQLKS